MNTKICTKCNKTLSLESFGNRKGKARKEGDKHAECKNCTAARRRFRYHNEIGFSEKVLKNEQISYAKNRLKVIEVYGGKCSCCGESNSNFLSFDHINGRKVEHSRQKGHMSGKNLVQWIVRNNYPKDIQILCYNCNCAKGFYGECPHKKELQDADRNSQQENYRDNLHEDLFW